jgi:hypothetical protein
MKIIIAASMSFGTEDDRKMMVQTLNEITRNITKVQVISRNATFGDGIAFDWATNKGYETATIAPDWGRKKASEERLDKMVLHADALIAFQDPDDDEGQMLIAKAKAANLKVKVFFFDPE